MSRNEGASIPNDESGHKSGQTVPIGNTGNLDANGHVIGQSVQCGNGEGNRDAIASRGTTKQLSDKV